MDTDSDGDPVHPLASGFEEEGELSDLDHNLTATEIVQALSEEQSYRDKLYVGSDHSCVGLIYWTWTTPLVQTTIHSQDQNSSH